MKDDRGELDLTRRIDTMEETIKDIRAKLKNLSGLEKIHQKNNGDLRVYISKIEKENRDLKKDNMILADDNAMLYDKMRKLGR
jgi:predicted  nucleic acid-binding Zn-ribbon protein